jgi:hypothetical protein
MSCSKQKSYSSEKCAFESVGASFGGFFEEAGKRLGVEYTVDGRLVNNDGVSR